MPDSLTLAELTESHTRLAALVAESSTTAETERSTAAAEKSAATAQKAADDAKILSLQQSIATMTATIREHLPSAGQALQGIGNPVKAFEMPATSKERKKIVVEFPDQDCRADMETIYCVFAWKCLPFARSAQRS